MRIFWFFIKLLVTSAVAGLLVYLFGGTLWLKIGSYPLLQDLAELPLYDRNISVYTHMCQISPASSNDSIPTSFQIRFLDNQTYVVELVCTLIENSPIELKRGTLPPLISKVPGSAGLTFPLEDGAVITSAIRLQSLGKELGIQLSGDTVTTGQNIQSIVGANPKAECVSFGFACCTQGSQAGQGELLSQSVTDCPTSCYPACGSLPFVELFNSDPPFDPQTREIAMSGGTLDVIYNYGVNPKTIKNVHIEYGDGKTQDSTLADGIFSHTYTCDTACRYTASLTITDASGNTSVATSQSKIYIVRR